VYVLVFWDVEVGAIATVDAILLQYAPLASKLKPTRNRNSKVGVSSRFFRV